MLETLLKHLKEQKDLGLTNDILMETFKSAMLGLKIPMLAKAKLIATICKSPKLNLKSTFFGMYSFLLTF